MYGGTQAQHGGRVAGGGVVVGQAAAERAAVCAHWRSPMWLARSARAGMARCTSADAATAACVVPAPMVTLPSATVMPCIVAMAPRSMSALGAIRPSFIDCSSVWPPAMRLAVGLRCLRARRRPRWRGCGKRSSAWCCPCPGFASACSALAVDGFPHGVWRSGHGHVLHAQRVADGVDDAAGGLPMAPASPQPFTPSGLWVQGVPLAVSTTKCGKSSARGIA